MMDILASIKRRLALTCLAWALKLAGPYWSPEVLIAYKALVDALYSHRVRPLIPALHLMKAKDPELWELTKQLAPSAVFAIWRQKYPDLLPAQSREMSWEEYQAAKKGGN